MKIARYLLRPRLNTFDQLGIIWFAVSLAHKDLFSGLFGMAVCLAISIAGNIWLSSFPDDPS